MTDLGLNDESTLQVTRSKQEQQIQAILNLTGSQYPDAMAATKDHVRY